MTDLRIVMSLCSTDPRSRDFEYTGGDTLEPLDKLGDKTVGIVGTGASAIQIVPS